MIDLFFPPPRESQSYPQSFRSRSGNAGFRLLEEQPGRVEVFKSRHSEITVKVCKQTQKRLFCFGFNVWQMLLKHVLLCICVLKQRRLEEGGAWKNGGKERVVAGSPLHKLPRQKRLRGEPRAAGGEGITQRSPLPGWVSLHPLQSLQGNVFR